MCEEIREYVKTLDIDDIIARTLEHSQLSEDTIYLLRCAHHFVVSGIESGLTLHEIATLMCRDYEEELPSKFEAAFDMVRVILPGLIYLKTQLSLRYFIEYKLIIHQCV